jgi:hypothetical protein
MNSATEMPRVSTSIRNAYEANRFARSNRAANRLIPIPATIKGDHMSLYKQRAIKLCPTCFSPRKSTLRQTGALRRARRGINFTRAFYLAGSKDRCIMRSRGWSGPFVFCKMQKTPAGGESARTPTVSTYHRQETEQLRSYRTSALPLSYHAGCPV